VDLLLLFLGMGVVTYIPRVAPLALLAGWRLPDWLLRLLEGFPVAVLAAFVVPLVLAPQGHLDLSLQNLNLPATAVTLIAALWSRSLIITVLVGTLAMALLRAF
jgi:branched-subunit amino acid transport protein